MALSGLTATPTNELFEVGFGGMITLTAAFVFLGLNGTTAAVTSSLPMYQPAVAMTTRPTTEETRR